MLDDGEIAVGVGDEEILGDGARDFGESIERLAGGAAMFGDIADEMGGREAIIPSINVCVSESDIKTVLVDGVFDIHFAGIEAGMAPPNTLVGESEVAISALEGELIFGEKVAGGW